MGYASNRDHKQNQTETMHAKRGVNFLTLHAKKVLFFVQIQCVFSYGIGAWGNMIIQSQ